MGLPSFNLYRPAVWSPLLCKNFESQLWRGDIRRTRGPRTVQHLSPPPPLAQTYPHICLWIHHCLSPRWTALPTCLKHQFLAVCLTQSVALTSSVSAGAVDIIWKACGRRISDAIMAPARWDWEKPRIVSVRMAGPGVRTGHLRATRRQRYQLYNMLNRCVLHGSKVGSEKAYKPAIL